MVEDDEEIDRGDESGAIDKLSGLAVEINLHSISYSKKDDGKLFRPFCGIGRSFKIIFQLAMKTFNHAIGRRVIV